MKFIDRDGNVYDNYVSVAIYDGVCITNEAIKKAQQKANKFIITRTINHKAKSLKNKIMGRYKI